MLKGFEVLEETAGRGVRRVRRQQAPLAAWSVGAGR